MSKTDELIRMIKENSIEELKVFFEKYPRMLKKTFSGFGSDGTALHCAAYFNKVDVIRFLVEEKGMNVNHQKGVKEKWPPILNAKGNSNYEAAVALLELGANPLLESKGGNSAYSFCKEQGCLGFLDLKRMDKHKMHPKAFQFCTDYLERKERERIENAEREEQERVEREQRKEQKRIEREQREEREKEEKRLEVIGKWSLTLPHEVVNEYKRHEQGYGFTDIFNFQASTWTRLTKNLVDKTFIQETLFFSNIPDRKILRQALEKLNELGGEVDETSVQQCQSMGKKKVGKFKLGSS